jgi:predicted ATPase
LPSLPSSFFGREAALSELVTLANTKRLLTLFGPAGIGKTRLLVRLGAELLPQFPQGVWWIDLASLSDSAILPFAIASAAGLDLHGGALTQQAVVDAMRTGKLLLLFDNCEHIIDSVAQTVEALCRANAALQVVTTSREPLDLSGEHLYRVEGLNVPPASEEDPLRLPAYDAVQLFLSRATAVAPRLGLDGSTGPLIADICRRLDGIPLAVELAAARVATLGLEAVAAGLGDRFALLKGGRRTALPRHQTLLAAFDWSYNLLTPEERSILCRLAVFTGAFTIEAAARITDDMALPRDERAECVARLYARSMLALSRSETAPVYSLLETTRAYAMRRLEGEGAQDVAKLQHATFQLEQVRAAVDAPRPEAGSDRARRERVLLDELTAALDWCFSPHADADLGLALTLAAIPLWIRMTLLEVCKSRIGVAMEQLRVRERDDGEIEVQLLTAQATVLQNSEGPSPEVTRIWERARALAEGANRPDLLLRTLWGLWIDARNGGRHREALQRAWDYRATVLQYGPGEDEPTAERLVGMSLLIAGECAAAQEHCRRAMEALIQQGGSTARFPFFAAHGSAARFQHALCLWLRGFPSQALQIVKEECAPGQPGPLSLHLCIVLIQLACPVAYLCGDQTLFGSFVAMLLESASEHRLQVWLARGHCWEGVLHITGGALETGLQILSEALETFPGGGGGFQHVWFLGELARGLSEAGQHAASLTTIEDALARADRGGELWCRPELLRLRGTALLRMGSVPAAEASFREALSEAGRQGALSWELRAATSLAQLLASSGSEGQARDLLRQTLQRFSEGHETADLVRASQLLRGFEGG